MRQLLTLAAAIAALAACTTNKTEEMKDTEIFMTPGGAKVEIACICHGSIAINYNGYSIQIDPVGEMDGKINDYGPLGKADAIFVTHEHYDHLSAETIDSLSKAGTLIFANASGCAKLGKGTALANGDSGLLTPKIRYSVVPAYNTTEGRERFHPKGNGNGYIFNVDGLTIYVAGDTEPIPKMSGFSSIYGSIDVAFLPVNQPYTMTVPQCVEAAKVIAPKVLIPYHYSKTDLSELPGLLSESGVEVRLHESLR
ncbi:MAG: MBL fold metallo-hydrolase [Bacteroidales bacterium]|nr:MBL fold metallo-hydrolase [Bacteroidales bacterium]